MNAIIVSESVIGMTAKAMYGRRRPNGVLVASDSGPTSSGNSIAKMPSALRTKPTSVAELVNCSRTGGR